MAQDYYEIVIRLVAALLAGGLIGLERSHRGRPAGFRTHALVCLASSLQGIMTGIGFLGAGVIIKKGFSVRGLTTAASIWITAALGILIGIGFYFAAAVGTALALGTLSLFRWVEARLPTETYASFMVRFKRGAGMSELATALRRDQKVCEYRIAPTSE